MRKALHTKRRSTIKGGLSLILAGLMFVPSAANSNYLYEVLPPELHPYVLLIVDNSGSMLCQDGLYDEFGNRTYEGLYQQEGDEGCHANYCRRADDSDLWVCPNLSEEEADNPYFMGTCLPEERGPWCDNTKTECVEICDKNCYSPCIETIEEDWNCRDGNTCIGWGEEEYNCRNGECTRYEPEEYGCVQGPCVETGTRKVNCRQGPCEVMGTEKYECRRGDCETWGVEDHNCRRGPCEVYNTKRVCDQGDCIDYNEKCENTTCETYKRRWVPQSGGECIEWAKTTGSSQCNSSDCRNNRCIEEKKTCRNGSCKTYGPKYDCRQEKYDCKEVCELKGKGDNQWLECHDECKTRDVDCKQDCEEYHQVCTSSCVKYEWEACTKKAPIVPGYWETTNQCEVWNQECRPTTCKTYEEVNCRQEEDPTSCRQYAPNICDQRDVCVKYGPDKCKERDKCEKYAPDICDDEEFCAKYGPDECQTRDVCAEHERICDTRQVCTKYETVCDTREVCVQRGPQVCDCREECTTSAAECDCPSRMETAQAVLETLIPGLDNLTLGLAKYGKFEPGGNREIGIDGDFKNCAVEVSNPLPGDRGAILEGVSAMIADGGTPIAKSLLRAREHIAEVAASDPAASCRQYFIVLVTDGEESCALDANYDADQQYLEDQVTALRNTSVTRTLGDSVTIDVRTFVLGFGPELATGDPEVHSLSALARLGGTAEVDGVICTPRGPGEACSSGSALFALRRGELVDKLNSAFQKITEGEYAAQAPVVGSVAQETSELGRISRNFMVYTTFRQPGYSGHVYGIRLFQESEDEPGLWEFTDLGDLDLDACGSDGNPCVFDAGRLLTNRTSARKIYSGVPGGKLSSNEDGLTLPMLGRTELSNDQTGFQAFSNVYASFSSVVDLPRLVGADRPPNLDENIADRLLELDSSSGSDDRQKIVSWLHGEGRSWKLGDIYHGGAAIVGRPPYAYRTRGYDQFKKALRDRPDMIYVGANDGMIHAFHASPDLLASGSPRWERAGEEAWAYLPVNMSARAASAILEGYEEEPRFFSQDLSCRVDDVLAVDNIDEEGELDCGEDPLCGWRTVLLCGQGWGGSWLVALDVSDPLDPKPIWESTHEGLPGEGPMGLGKTWSIPSVGLLNLAADTSTTSDTMPTWVAVYGSGYNSDMKDLNNEHYEAYRLLNLPFDGAFAYHGNGTSNENPHVFVQDLATGRFLKIFHQHEGGTNLGSIVADIPLIDLDGDGFIDVAYVGNWNSRMDRIAFVKNTSGGELVRPPRTHPSNWSNSCTDLFAFGEGRPITSSPSAMVDPIISQRVYLFAGAGVDRGSFPDEQTESEMTYGFRGFLLDDDGSAACPVSAGGEETGPIPNEGNLCLDAGEGSVSLSGILSANSRLLGSPLLTLQANTDRWLSFTAWNPDATTCSDGTASLYCLNVNGGSRCVPCGDLDGGTELGGSSGDGNVTIETGGRKPTSPVTADGQIYVVGPQGPQRVANQDGESEGITGRATSPNVNAPRAVVISWRELFEE